MDLLFSKYASPFLFLDGMIETGRFTEFVLEFMEIHNDEYLYEFWLHKVFNKTFEEFKAACTIQTVNTADLGTTIKESEEILDNFVPEEVAHGAI